MAEDLRDQRHPGDERGSPKSGPSFSLKERAHGFRYAGRGIVAMVATQHNARIHLVATIAVGILAGLLGVSPVEWSLLILAVAAVWVAEAMNTALESLADALIPEHHPLVGRAKDVAAGGVLIVAIGAAMVGFLILGPPLLAWLGQGSSADS